MINKMRAIQLAEKQLEAMPILSGGDTCVLFYNGIEEYKDCWVFHYQSKEYVKTGSIEYMLAGNAPILIAKENGRAFVTGTAHEIGHYIALFRKGELTEGTE